MSEEEKKELKENIKKQIKKSKSALKAAVLTVGLSGVVAGPTATAATKTNEDAFPQGVEATYEPQANVNDVEGTILFEDAMSMAGEGEQYYQTPEDYVRENGLIYDARLSRGLSRHGDGKNFAGYYGAFINPYAELSNEQVVFLPNDMLRNKIRHTSVDYALASQAQKTDMYFPKHNDRFGPAHGPVHQSETGRKVRKAARVVNEILYTIDRIGHSR
ncbi:MAG: hypothetical protein IKW39_04990 [Alphaproteobacteria bacterium]|nr:hypothetical protein [Alphaproteobacteria bacterium]